MDHFVLADCNNFYISCERLFNPKLEGKPVIALSQNDGCIISRSQEAKKLGIKMGEPYFKIKDFCERAKVIVFSSNYQLYGDISERVMDVLSNTAPEIEIYSIDEAFLKYPGNISSDEIQQECIKMKKTVQKWVGIPISIGIGPTKTLAKVANHMAKKNRDVGIFNLSSPDMREQILKELRTEDVWGIGYRLSERLRGLGIFTAWEFAQSDPYFIRKKMGVVGERMLWELRGISCLNLTVEGPQKTISFSRSFGKTVTDISEIAEALATFVNKACIKLRRQNSFTHAIVVYLESSFFVGEKMFRRPFSMIKSFPRPVNDTPLLITAAKDCLTKLFSDKERYKKCGVILLDLIFKENIVPDLFLKPANPKRNQLMHTMDRINACHGKNTVFFGAMGVSQNWKSRSEKRSNFNTTSWDHLPTVKAR